jgi:plasmid stabilization system protein ParE
MRPVEVVASFLYHPGANDETKAALRWYVARSPRKAHRFDSALERIFDEIVGRPDRFPRLDHEFHEAAVPKFPYSVIYRALPSGDVQVIAIAHASREPGYWRDRA